MCYNDIIALTSSSSTIATVATIGGAVGGAVLLVSSLCIVVWCTHVRHYKRKKPVHSNQPCFRPSLCTYADNQRYIFEIENTEATTGVEAKMCKWQQCKL